MPGSRVGFMLVGDWAKSEKMLAAAPRIMDKAIDKAILAEGMHMAAEVKKRIMSNIPPENSASTRFSKGSSKTLIDKGDLLGSIAAMRSAKHKVYVGISRTAKRGAIKLARVHEEGATIVQQISDRQRKFLMAKLAKSGSPQAPSGAGGAGGILVIHIPARPFMRPTFEAEKDKSPQRFLQRVSDNIDAELAKIK